MTINYGYGRCASKSNLARAQYGLDQRQDIQVELLPRQVYIVPTMHLDTS